MSNIMIPLCGKWRQKYDFLAGASQSERESTVIIFPADTTARIQDGGNGRSWIYAAEISSADAWDSVVYDARAKLAGCSGPKESLIVIVDAERSAEAPAFLKLLAGVIQVLPIHIVFLADSRSPYAAAQQAFFQMILDDVNGSAQDSGLTWFTFTMLADETVDGMSGQLVKEKRDLVLPYVLRRSRVNDAPHTCYTVAVDSMALAFDRLEQVSQAQAVRFVCRRLSQKTPGFNELATLLMNGDSYPNDVKAQQDAFMKNLLGCLKLQPVTGVDLLVQKHDPRSDANCRDLLARVLADNPDLDARRYDAAMQEQELESLPCVYKAVTNWEQHVLKEAEAFAVPDALTQLLAPGGEWDQRIAHDFQKEYFHHEDPLMMCSGKIAGKYGYTDEATAAVQSSLANVFQHFRQAVFQACLRLMHCRLHAVYEKICAIRQERLAAIQSAGAALQPLSVLEDLTANWCALLQQTCEEAAGSMSFRFEAGVPAAEVIRRYGQAVYERAKSRISLSAGAAELADHADDVVHRLQQTFSASPLVSQDLWGCAQHGGEEWFADPRLTPTIIPCSVTDQPFVLRITRFFLELQRAACPVQQLFKGKIIDLGPAAPPTSTSPRQARSERPAAQETPAVPKEYLPYCGKIDFFWQVSDANHALIRYCLAGSTQVLLEEKIARHQMVGTSYTPGVTLPTGVKLDIRIVYQGYHADGLLQEELHYQTMPSKLTVEFLNPTEGLLFRKRSYTQLRVSGADEHFCTNAVVMNTDSRCFCRSVTWQQDGACFLSEYLPEGGSWTIVPSPDSPFAFELA